MMFERIDVKEIEASDLQLNMVIRSIEEMNTEGVLWESDGTYLLWDKGNVVFYLFGKKLVKKALKDAKKFFTDKLSRQAKNENFSHFKARNLTEIPDDLFGFIFHEFRTEGLNKHFYRYGGGEPNIEGQDDRLRFMPIDKELLSDARYGNLTEVLTEVKWMWPSFQRFFENGFGTAALKEDTIVCWCTAEYVSESRCGVGIETAGEHRGEGIASRTAARFIKSCQKRDITPYWECMADNTPSVRLAEKLGFEKISEPSFIFGKF